MSSITERMVLRFDRWLDRVVMTDDRYICAACDDRFRSRAAGIDHVLHCHPEYQGVVVYEGQQQVQPVPQSRSARWLAPGAPVPVPVPVSR